MVLEREKDVMARRTHVVSLLPLCTNVLENAVLWNSAVAKSRVNER